MDSKSNVNAENFEPVLNESWWNSLLSTEDKYQGNAKRATNRQNENKKNIVDWVLMKKYFYNDEVFSARVIGYNKGGLLVEGDHFKGFIPNSHIDEIAKVQTLNAKVRALKQYVGQSLSVKVIECDEKMGKLILSERAAKNIAGKRLRLIDNLAIGDVVKGVLTNVTKFGIFLELGGTEGLVHIS